MSTSYAAEPSSTTTISPSSFAEIYLSPPRFTIGGLLPSTGCPIHKPGSNPVGASTLPDTTFQSVATQVALPRVTVAILSALPSAKSCAVPVPSSPGTPKISTITSLLKRPI